MIEITVNNTKKSILSLPCLLINKENKQIILVTQEESSYFVGTIVAQGNQQNFPVGYHSSYWPKENLELFYGTISLSNNLENQKNNYKNCGIKVGDKVEVLRKAHDYEKDWENNWIPSMDKYIGTICEVVGNSNKKSFDLINKEISLDSFRFPHFVLEKIIR